VNINGKYVYFFNNLEMAVEEISNYDNFTVYQYMDLSLYVIGEVNATKLKRPHITDWNGTLFSYNRIDGEITISWRVKFINSLKELKFKNC
jgi:hypothetical protein